MIKIYQPLENYQGIEPSTLFLAGGIDRAPNWQQEAITFLNQNTSDFDLAVFNPRRSIPFSKKDYEDRQEQVIWEFKHLRDANIILFWFPENAPCTTSLLELGYWLNSSKVVIGINPGHYKEKSIKTQINLLNKSKNEKNIQVLSTLNHTLIQALVQLKGLM